MYHGSGDGREERARRRPRHRLASGRVPGPRLALGAALLAALSAGGCSISMPAGPLVETEIATGSTGPRAASPLHPDLGPEDWRRARAALGVAVDPQGNGAGVSWDNPETAMRGSFTSVGQPFVRDDEVCRAFLATVHGQEMNASLQGTACRPSGEEWSIREVKPFRRPG